MDWTQIKYFRPEEWQKDPERVSPTLVKVLDEIRRVSLFPIVIHVAWDWAGHSPKSFHYSGLAVDFHWAVDPKEFSYGEQFMLLSSFRELGGIGFYPYWNNPGWHVDLRDRNPRLLWYRDENGNYVYGYKEIIKALF